MSNSTIQEVLLNSSSLQTSALRLRLKLQPAGGMGDKLFPPTYEGPSYAMEERLLGDRRVKAVLLNSVPAEAARIEQALVTGLNDGEIYFPTFLLELGKGYPSLRELELPHRVFDAYLVESTIDKTPFWKSPEGQEIHAFVPPNATGLYRQSPASLIFGGWDTHTENKTLSFRFKYPRALVSEIVAFDITEQGVKPSSKGDPLNLTGTIFSAPDGSWTSDESKAAKDAKGNAVKYKEKGAPSEIGLGQITPSLKEQDGTPHLGGFCSTEVKLTSVLSFAALRRFRFPLKPETPAKPEVNEAGRAVLAALAVYGLAKSHESGYWLRSRCDLVPDGDAALEIVKANGQTEQIPLPSSSDAAKVFKTAVQAAESKGLVWRKDEVKAVPTTRLAELIQKQGILG